MTERRDLTIDPAGSGNATSIDDVALQPGDTVRFLPGRHLVTRTFDVPDLTIVGVRDGDRTPILHAPSGASAFFILGGGSDLSHDPGTVAPGGLIVQRSAGPLALRDVTIEGTLFLRCDATVEGVVAQGDVAVEAPGASFERCRLHRLVISPSGAVYIRDSEIKLLYAAGDLVAVDTSLGLSNRVVGGSQGEPKPNIRLLRGRVAGRLDVEEADCWIDGGELTELFARSAVVHVRSCSVPARVSWARIMGKSVIRVFDAGPANGLLVADTRARVWVDGAAVPLS